MTHESNSGLDEQLPPPPRGGTADDSGRELRASAVRSDAQRGVTTDCGAFWQHVREGSLFVTDSFSTPDRAYLTLQRRAGPALEKGSRNLDILERVLLGESQKAVAIELGLKPSTVTTCCRVALRKIGIDAQASRVPPLLCMLAHAGLQQAQAGELRAADMAHGGVRYLVVSLPLQNAALAAHLSPAEHVVALMRIEGRSLAEIARVRHTSQRTVANQLGTAFRRLGISGRSSLVELFLRSSVNAELVTGTP